MALTTTKKKEIIDGYKTHDGDTGSPEVQIALLSGRIEQLADHFKTHKKDHHSRRGLLMLINKRRKLLSYIKLTDRKRYQQVIESLGLRK